MSTLDSQPYPLFSEVALAHQKATSGEWKWNQAGEIFAVSDSHDRFRIGQFPGSLADAESVCRLHNAAVELLSGANKAAPEFKLPRPVGRLDRNLPEPPDLYRVLPPKGAHLFIIHFPEPDRRAGFKVDDVGIVVEATPAFEWAIGGEFETLYRWCGQRSMTVIKASSRCKNLRALMKQACAEAKGKVMPTSSNTRAKKQETVVGNAA